MASATAHCLWSTHTHTHLTIHTYAMDTDTHTHTQQTIHTYALDTDTNTDTSTHTHTHTSIHTPTQQLPRKWTKFMPKDIKSGVYRKEAQEARKNKKKHLSISQ